MYDYDDSTSQTVQSGTCLLIILLLRRGFVKAGTYVAGNQKKVESGGDKLSCGMILWVRRMLPLLNGMLVACRSLAHRRMG